MLRLLLILFVVSIGAAPAPAFAQAADNGMATNATVAATANVSEAANSVEGTDLDGEDPPAEIDRSPIEASGNALLKLFVLAVILESALALLFNWRPFVARYDGRGIKAPISLAAALILVFAFEPDAIASLMSGYGPDVGQAGRFFARIIEAMVIAGGSAGVNRMLIALGFRAQTRATDVISRPRSNEAWISVGLERQQDTKGPVYVEIKVGNKPAEIAGTITGTRAVPRSYFRRDYGRLPPAGGWSVLPGEEVAVTLVDQGGKRSSTWGPYRLAAGAIVDIDLVL